MTLKYLSYVTSVLIIMTLKLLPRSCPSLQVHLVRPLYKHLMGWPISIKDLEHVDDEIYRFVNSIFSISYYFCA